MSDYSALKATINANVKANNNQEITGAIMNSVLNAMVNSLGAGYQFIGVATPTNPGTAQTPDYKCFYLATTPGTYTNLGGLVVADGEVALLKWDTAWHKVVTGIASADKLNQLGQEVNGEVVEERVEMAPESTSGYFNCNTAVIGSAFSKSSPASYEGRACWKLAVSTGEIYSIYSKGGGNYDALYVLTGENNIVLAKVGADDTKADGLELNITEDGYLYVNDSEYSVTPGKVYSILRHTEGGYKDYVDEYINGEKVESTTNVNPTSVGAYYNCNTASVGSAFNKTATAPNADHACWRLNVKEGEKYNIRSEGNGNTGALYVLTGADDIVLAKVGALNTKDTGLVVEVTQNGVLYVNDISYTTEAGSVSRTTIERVGGTKNEIYERVLLGGKKVVFFGDSLVAITDTQGKSVTDYIAEQTDAEVINLSIGGTRLAQRGPVTLPFDSASAAWAGLDIVNMVKAACTQDFSVIEAANTKLKQETAYDFTEKINTLESIDWSGVDCIIVEGGGNDWNSGRYMGEVDDNVPDTVYGALNLIIQWICSTYPHIKLFGMSNQVLYAYPDEFDASIEYEIGDFCAYNGLYYTFTSAHQGAWDANDVSEVTKVQCRVPEYFSDNKVRRIGYTLRQLVRLIEEHYVSNHLSYYNVYDKTGWNEWNFSTYYNDNDSHHPYKGLEFLGMKISGWLKTMGI